jgi:hypothetical protein
MRFIFDLSNQSNSIIYNLMKELTLYVNDLALLLIDIWI